VGEAIITGTMSVLRLPIIYLGWHYTRALVNYIHISQTYLWFVYNFFSIPLLLRTFVKPWRRLQESKKRTEKVEDLFSRIIVNTLMRLVGMIMRAGMIALGLLSLLITLLVLATFFCVWLVLPIIIVGFFIVGIKYVVLSFVKP
jgi:hypothetical protein